MKKLFILLLIAFCSVLFANSDANARLNYKCLMFIDDDTNTGLTSSYQEVISGGGTLAPYEISTTGIQMTTTNLLNFRDSDIKIYSSVDGQLDLDADTEVEVTTATFDVAVTSGVTINGALTDIGGGSYSTVTGDNDLGVAGDLEVDQRIDVDGDADFDGTTNLDIVVIDGAVTHSNGAFTINETGGNNDTRIESQNNANMIFVDASTDYVGINNATPSEELDVTGDVEISGTLAVTGASTFTGAINGNITSTGTSTFSDIDCGGGEIDGTTMGTTTPSTGKFTSLETTGEITAGNSLNMAGYRIDLERSGSYTSIDAGSGDIIDFHIGGSDRLHMSTTEFYPTTTATMSLGSSSYKFRELYLSSNANVGGNLSLTGNATVAGGIDATEAITSDAMSMFVAFNLAESDTGSDTYTVSPSPAITSYTKGLIVIFTAVTNNTGACTINVNGLGAKDIKIMSAGSIADPANDDIDADGIYILIYDGTQFQLINPS